MKKTTLKLISIALLTTIVLAMTSCGSMNNMSYEDSYRMGYDIGRALRGN